MIQRIIPGSGEALPVIGLGTWQTFDVAEKAELTPLQQVLQLAQQMGSSLIDSSPMYGRAETVVGNLLENTPIKNHFFYATKVWTTGRDAGVKQMEASLRKLKRTSIELMQIHNLVDWKTHLPTLNDWKAAGKIKYTGITHYTDAAHPELEKVFTANKVDFVQFNYSIFSRHAEKRLLPAAADKGVATLINRPFGEGAFFAKTKNKSLPPLAAELGIQTWSQYFLKFILSHPTVTCIIPATSNPQHLQQNLEAGDGPLPDAATREKMAAFVSGW